jgi:Arc/MetJ-type ribon-helix-helix transcriptional regulator/RNA polymerase subunit RPABC4/transcription elongation factor Spt4
MSKITFRADDELVRRLEALDASKSEVMREALRTYLDRAEREPEDPSKDHTDASLDAAVSERIDELIADRLDAHLDRRRAGGPQDVNVNISLDPAAGAIVDEENRPVEASESGVNAGSGSPRKTQSAPEDAGASRERTCTKCGEAVDPEHVYCPNCGGKASHRVFCECGDEIRSDWAFCPSCGRRTPAADVLDNA